MSVTSRSHRLHTLIAVPRTFEAKLHSIRHTHLAAVIGALSAFLRTFGACLDTFIESIVHNVLDLFNDLRIEAVLRTLLQSGGRAEYYLCLRPYLGRRHGNGEDLSGKR
jgi:hypothetical protein